MRLGKENLAEDKNTKEGEMRVSSSFVFYMIGGFSL